MGLSLYDDLAERYDRHNTTNPWNELYDRPAIHALAGDVAGLDVLDVGCASGVLSAQLHGRGARVVGLDASRVLVGIAAERYPAIEFHCADLAEPLEVLADGSFDLVTASLVMHYVEGWEPTLRELRRVLRVGGALVMSVHHPEGWHWFDLPNYFATERVTDVWQVDGTAVEVQFYHRPLGAMFGALRAAGFRVDEIVEPSPLPQVEELDRRAYELLTTAPRFLYFRAVNAGAAGNR
jgi:SAM-dependent methyltransferase